MTDNQSNRWSGAPFRTLSRAVAACVLLAISAANVSAQDADGALSAKALIERTSALLDDTQSYTFHVEKIFDLPLAKGGKIQLEGSMDVAVRRPDRFYVSYGDNRTALEFWYDGETFSIQNHRDLVHTSAPAGDTIGETADLLEEKFDLVLPLAELISDSSYRQEAAAEGRRQYLGVRTVNDVPAHHLLFQGPDLDWQIWIAAEGEPLPLKLVVVRKDDPDLPQQTIFFSEWDLKADLPDEVFEAQFEPESARASFLASRREQ